MRLDPVLRGELEKLAQEENRSLANMIETLVKEALAFRQKAAPSETTLNHPAASPDRDARQTRNQPA
jgi:hypothetical protein